MNLKRALSRKIRKKRALVELKTLKDSSLRKDILEKRRSALATSSRLKAESKHLRTIASKLRQNSTGRPGVRNTADAVGLSAFKSIHEAIQLKKNSKISTKKQRKQIRKKWEV